jgi:glycosyltransferase involved in cell wall biosynthesis
MVARLAGSGSGTAGRAERLELSPMASVVIPAHNEEAVIGRCLGALTDGIGPDDVEIIVVCNGCTDRTAQMAAATPGIEVIETPVASKSAALNLGDEHATSFPRVYLDADVELPGQDFRALMVALDEPDGPLAAGASMRVELGGRPWPIRAYYRVWTALPYVSSDMIGSGVFALSEAGRARFETFPSIIADDLFVYRLFQPGERRRVEGATFTVHPPATLGDLLKVQARRRAGIIEHRQMFGAGVPQVGPSVRQVMLELARDPRWWPSLAVYVGVAVAGRLRGQWKARFGDLKVWEREDSSRNRA